MIRNGSALRNRGKARPTVLVPVWINIWNTVFIERRQTAFAREIAVECDASCQFWMKDRD